MSRRQSVTFLEPNQMLKAALAYALRGWRVFPVHGVVFDADGAVRCTCPRGSDCPSKKMGKHPCINQWQNIATCDAAQIRDWWKQWPDANVAIATGGDGPEVPDFDVKDGGLETLKHLEGDGDLGDPLVVDTGGGGKHLFYASSGRLKTKTSVLPGVDTRGAGGYVVAPPSRHRSKKRYEFDLDAYGEGGGDEVEDLRQPGPMPDWLLDRLVPTNDRVAEGGLRGARAGAAAESFVVVKAALKFVGYDPRENWLAVGMGIHHDLGEDGRPIWDEWSEQSDKFNADDQQQTWESFGKSAHSSPVTLGTVFHMARAGGYTGPIPAAHDQWIGIVVRRPNRREGKVDLELLIEGAAVRVSMVNIRKLRSRNETRRDLFQAAEAMSSLGAEGTKAAFDAAWSIAEEFANKLLSEKPCPAAEAHADSLTDLNPETIAKLKAQASEARDKECERRVSDLTEEQLGRAMRLGESSDLLDKLVSVVERLGHVGEAENVAIMLLVYWSCRRADPLHVMVLGNSSSGKSNLTSKCARLVPSEFVLELTEMTPKYLAHVGMFDLAAKVIVLGERELGDEELVALKTKLMREMISNGHITQATVEGDSGKNEGRTKIVIGPVASSETTTKSSVFPEDKNRRIVLESDMSDVQTTRVLECVAGTFDGSRVGLPAEELSDTHSLFRLLKRPAKIIVEFASLVLQVLPVNLIEVRRLSSQVLGLIAVSAYIHQMQRVAEDAVGNLVPWSERKNGELILKASPRDYEIIARLLNPHLGRALRGELTGKEKLLLEQIQELVKVRGRHAIPVADVFTTTELRVHLEMLTREDVDMSNLRKRLKALEAHGAIEFDGRDDAPHAPNRYRLLVLEGLADQDGYDPLFAPENGLLPESYPKLWERGGAWEELSPQAFGDEGVESG
jgi:Bifunctional DNA primase/polymerase, N-terminal/Primase C terminal 2 (PriCT-2)